MTTAAIIGLAVLGASWAAMIVVRLKFLTSCPRCGGRGLDLSASRRLACWACSGTGLLRLPDTVPVEWTERDPEA